MARDNRPAQQICPSCKGKAWKITPKQRIKNGKPVTENVQEPCPQCGGVGWVNR
ncbi:hypothetical protein GCM10009745_08230 [Kribbella yunnanensis]|uniref:Transcription factor zinc-finger domain-containing protein n=1 Tax=Kribbella yunnanensis TaxID=190194 RepID=A0ABP4S9F2_9ACTN